MSLAITYQRLRSSIVALCGPAHGDRRRVLPEIIGTGFVIDPRGIIITNRHVAEVLRKLAPRDAKAADAAYATIFGNIRPDGDGYAQSIGFATICRLILVKELNLPHQFYGPIPDLAIVTLDMCDLPAAELAPPGDYWQTGLDIATAGFPLGISGLVANNTIHQFTPFLRKGIISSVHPFPGPSPHGFTIDIMAQGGQSGSPIFRCDDGTVIGVLYAGFEGTNITFGVPSPFVSETLHQVLADFDVRFDGLRSWHRMQEEKVDTWPANPLDIGSSTTA